MRLAPLPLAPRPHAGEALSSWVRRVAARYDLTADNLVRHVLGQRSFTLGRVERLDGRADPELEEALARAAQIDLARIRSLRVVPHDGAAWCWHRVRPAWCPACFRGDLARDGESYARATWRLGCVVLCPVHNLPLEDRCRRCFAEAYCHFGAADGRTRLACNICARPVDPVPRSPPQAGTNPEGAFGIRVTPELTALLRRLQDDLHVALTGRAPALPWGRAWTIQGLITIVRDLTESLVYATRARVEQQIVWETLLAGNGGARLVYEPITPAALGAYGSHGALAIIAAALESATGCVRAGHLCRWDGVIGTMTLAWFLERLPAPVRRLLWARSVLWETRAREALEAAGITACG